MLEEKQGNLIPFFYKLYEKLWQEILTKSLARIFCA